MEGGGGGLWLINVQNSKHRSHIIGGSRVIGPDVLVCDEKNLQWILNQLQVVKVHVCVYQTTIVKSLQEKKAVYFTSSII